MRFLPARLPSPFAPFLNENLGPGAVAGALCEAGLGCRIDDVVLDLVGREGERREDRFEGPMINGSFRAAVFDLDGTLLDSYEGIRAALNPVLVHFGKAPVSIDQTRLMVGEGLPRLIQKAVGPEAVEEGVRLFRERYRDTALTGSSFFPGAEDLIEELSRRRVPMSIASNKPALFSRQILESLGSASRFVFVGGPDMGFAPKPDPGMALAALLAMGTTAQETLFVGDMPIDIQTARAVGMPVAVLPTGSSTREELGASAPDQLLATLGELLPLFREG